MLKTSVRQLLIALVIGTPMACADTATPLAPHTAEPVALIAPPKGGKKVAVCKLQKEEWKTEQIGTRGGRVSVGGISLSIAPGALSRTVSITAHKLPRTSASVQFLPEGLQFAVPATLTMNYTECDTPLLGVNVVYVKADTITEVEPSNNHPLLKFVQASIKHFSSYAIAY